MTLKNYLFNLEYEVPFELKYEYSEMVDCFVLIMERVFHTPTPFYHHALLIPPSISGEKYQVITVT